MLHVFYNPYDPFGTIEGERTRVSIELGNANKELEQLQAYAEKLKETCREALARYEASNSVIRDILDEMSGKKPPRLSQSKLLRNSFRNSYKNRGEIKWMKCDPVNVEIAD